MHPRRASKARWFQTGLVCQANGGGVELRRACARGYGLPRHRASCQANAPAPLSSAANLYGSLGLCGCSWSYPVVQDFAEKCLQQMSFGLLAAARLRPSSSHRRMSSSAVPRGTLCILIGASMALQQACLPVVREGGLRQPGFSGFAVDLEPLPRNIFDRKISLYFIRNFAGPRRGNIRKLP